LADSRSASLPIKRDLALAYAFSLVIALLMAISAVAGLLFPDSIYPADELIRAFAPVDLFHLLVGLPILLGSMWMARRAKLLGLLSWPGVLLYVLYGCVLSLIGVPFGALSLPYLLLVTLSAYTIIGVVANIDGETVRQRLIGIVPAESAGGVLAGLSGLFIALAVIGIITALLSQRSVRQLELMLWIADLSTVGTACLAGGILLMRRKAIGYTSGTGLLLAFSMLFIGLIPSWCPQRSMTVRPST
jgi:hypothetical protein